MKHNKFNNGDLEMDAEKHLQPLKEDTDPLKVLIDENASLLQRNKEILEALKMAVPFLNIVTYDNQKGYEALMDKIGLAIKNNSK